MQKLTDEQAQVEVGGETVRQVIEALETRYPGFKERVCEGDRIRPGLAVAIDGEISPEGLRKKVLPDSEVHFLPAIGGG